MTVAGAVSAMVMGLLPGASADDPTLPSRDDVESAERHGATTAEEVGRIKSELVAAEENLRQLELAAQKAVEAYNGAVYELGLSRASLRRAERVSSRAGAGVERLRNSIATAVVGDSLDGGALADIGVLLQDPEPGALMDQLSSYRGFTGAMENELDDFDAQSIVADVLAEQAQGALIRSERAVELMQMARREAKESLTLAEQAAAGLEARKDELVVELAAAQDISVELAHQRQRALADRAEQEARRRAEQQALEQAAREDRQELRAQARAVAREQARADVPGGADDRERTRNAGEPEPDAAREPTRDHARDLAAEAAADQLQSQQRGRREAQRAAREEARADRRERREQRRERRRQSGDDGGGASSSGVQAAVAFALAQVGEPYVWGASGPDAWDCSGLTMSAWDAGGRALSHYSVAQYAAVSPVSMSSIRRGDLLFWSDGGPSSIFHVALYLGDGMMVHAPRSGRDVEVVSMYYWVAPDLAGRP